MRILGIDPGARDTGVVVIDDAAGDNALTPALIAVATISRTDRMPLLEVPPSYLVDILAAATDAVRTHNVDLIGVESIKRPSWRVNGKAKPLDPSAIMATSIVFGAILGRAWTVPVVAVRPGGNGSYLPLATYPGPLATNGKGHDARRHERSAYDVAAQARTAHRFAVMYGSIYP